MVSVPLSLLISEWIGKLKGGSSYDINQTSNHKILQWQRDYGIVSFGAKDLQWMIDYVLNQREHHRKGMTNERLEKITNDDESSNLKQRTLKRPKTIYESPTTP